MDDRDPAWQAARGRAWPQAQRRVHERVVTEVVKALKAGTTLDQLVDTVADAIDDGMARFNDDLNTMTRQLLDGAAPSALQ